MNRSSGLVVGVALLAGLVLQASLHAAVSAPQTFLPGSVRPVDATPPTAADPHKPYISRRTLRADETAASLDIEVVLQMHNFDELQERAARGDRIPFSEMAAKYYPAAADYQKVVNWLVQRGFTIQQQDADHMAVFASARVDRLQTGLSLKFARVTQDGSEYTSAISSPAVPSELASVLVGINGLQPNIQMHTHSIIRPLYTDGPGALYGPGQIATAYDAAHLYSYSIKGSGQTIAIVINTYPLMSDLTAFWSAFAINRGTSTVTFIEAVTNAGTLAAPSGEETLDTEWSSSIAPGANVRVYATYDLKSAHLDRGYAKVYSDIQAGIPIHEMSMSYGGAEYYYVSEGDSSQLYTDDQYFAELAVAGVTNFASTGDVGATPSSTNGAGGATLTPETPSTDPNVTAVGGTALMADSSGNVSGEVVWNETSATQGSGATGGGTSYYFARPSWQTGATLPASSYRMVPDVASSADPTYGAYIILNGNYYDIGGTSWSSPTWAGFGALLNQARANAGQSALGILGPYLYPQIGTVNFRDITSGSNIYDSTLGYTAGIGYDLATGCGAPDVTQLARTVTGISTLATPVVLESVASVQVQGGTPYSINLPLDGSGVEGRLINMAMQLVFTFNQPVTSGTAAANNGATLNGAPTFSGNTMIVNLSNVTDQENYTVTVSALNGSIQTAQIGFGALIGDVDGNGAVNSQDLVAVRNALGSQTGVAGFNPAADIDENGAVNSQDLVQVRNHLGNQLP